MTIEEILSKEESQTFDRKSIMIKPTDLSDTVCAFANADGGVIVIGVSDKHRRIEGVGKYKGLLNEILRVPVDFCNPSVPLTTELVPCTNSEGAFDHVLLMRIEASSLLHSNQADEVYVRVGDKSKKLGFQDRLSLLYAKGLRSYEDEPVYGATIYDIDLGFVREYTSRIGYRKTPEEYIRQDNRFVTKKGNLEQVSVAAILLFGKNPQEFFPRARIRFVRYDGNEPKVGNDMNVIKDVCFEGRILDQVRDAVDYIKTQMKERTYLGNDGVFTFEEEYGEFVRTEVVLNAVTHRDYGIKGTDIQIKMFNDRLEVDSPGTFAGMVRKDNIRYTHFSRNPKIAAFLRDYGYVKEYGEGVDRMCLELEALGLPDPVFHSDTFILKTIIEGYSSEKLPIGGEKVADSHEKLPIGDEKVADSHEKLPIGFFIYLCEGGRLGDTTKDNLIKVYHEVSSRQVFGSSYIEKVLSCSTRTARNLMSKLRDIGAVVPVFGKGKGMYRFKFESEIPE